MKNFLLLCILIPVSLFAEDLTTRSGKKYIGIVVTKITPEGIALTHADGVARIALADLPDEFQAKYRDKVAAMKESAEKIAAATKIKAEAESKLKAIEAEREIAALTKSIKEVETGMINFLDKEFILEGEIDCTSYFNFAYSEAQETHYAFQIKQGGKTANVYMQRAEGAALRRKILDAGTPLKGKFSCIIFESRYNKASGSIYAELAAFHLEGK